MHLDHNGIKLEYFLPILDMSAQSHLLALPVGPRWLLGAPLAGAPQAPRFGQHVFIPTYQLGLSRSLLGALGGMEFLNGVGTIPGRAFG